MAATRNRKSKDRDQSVRFWCRQSSTDYQPDRVALLYEFLTRSRVISNRNLTPIVPSSSEHISEIFMSDILFLATGLGMFALFALYAQSLGRI